MKRRSSSITENLLYPKTTLYLRVAEMILCVVCLILAFYFWNSENTLLGATVVLFATSFGFLVVTLVDVLASLKRRQYTAPVWVGLAFLAAFMCFLSFGFMILQTILLHVVIGAIFAVTGVVFLVDGIIIIVNIFQSKIPKRIHPVQEEKESIDQPMQVEDDLEIIEELPVEVRRLAPVATAPSRRSPSTKSSPRSSFKITSYGGTFPVGGSDAPPLPTPDNLTGMEPAVPAQLYVPRRNTRDNSPETRSISSENSTNKRPLDENRNLYPSVQEERIPEDKSQFLNGSRHMESDLGVSQQIQSTTYSSAPTCEEKMFSQEKSQPQNQRPPPLYQDSIQGAIITPYQAAGEPQSTVTVGNVQQYEKKYQRETVPGDAQACQCCGTWTQEPREQITPYVTHHYNQTPCVCGYTHYQASTVVKGAVRQYPQDTLQQQQRMIKEQLEQMRDEHMYHGCSCHDKPTKEKNVPYMHLVRDAPVPEKRRDSSSLGNFLAGTEQDSNRSLNIESGSLLEVITNSLRSRRQDNMSDQNLEDKSINRKVTIGTMDVISPSDASEVSNTSQYRRWAEQLSLEDRQSKNTDPEIPTNQPRRSSLKQNDRQEYPRPTMPPLDTISESVQESVEAWPYSEPDYDSGESEERRPTVEMVNTTIVPQSNPRMTVVSKKEEANYLKRFREVVHPADSSKETILSVDLDDLPYQRNPGVDERLIEANRKHDAQDHEFENVKRRSELGTREVLDNYDVLMKHRSEETPEQPSSYGTDGKRFGQDYAQETSSIRSRRPSSDRSTATNQGEQWNVSPSPETWTSEAQEAYKSSIASSPFSRPPIYVCRGALSPCLCGANMRNEIQRSSYRRNEGKRPSYERRTTNTDRHSLRELPPEISKERQFSREKMRYPDSLNVDNAGSVKKDQTENALLPRMLDPIQEQRMRESIHLSDSEDKISHIPPYHEGFPRDVMMIKQMSCICECICNPSIDRKDVPNVRRSSVSSNTKKFDAAPLHQQPYHPKDDFKLPENSFTNFSRASKAPDAESIATRKKSSMKQESLQRGLPDDEHQAYRSSRASSKKMSYRGTLDCVDECPDCSSKRDGHRKECPEECMSCPVRRRRLEREARLMAEYGFQEYSSTPKRGSLKRSYPDDRI